jgi:signal transduction histidine kinase
VQRHNLGVLVMWSNKPESFSVYQTQLVSLFADQAALALYNAHIHAQNHQMAIKEERHRIARELHDTVTQSFYSISMAARTSLKLLKNNNDQKDLDVPLEHILTLSKNALVEMREQIYHLSPRELIDKGLNGALASHCAQIESRYGLQIELVVPADLSLSTDQQVALYYIAREALWNSLKHSEATHVQIRLEEDELDISLTIHDNGHGFDPSIASKQESMGLKNMEERAQILGGYLRIQSGSHHGCTVTARIPRYAEISFQ